MSDNLDKLIQNVDAVSNDSTVPAWACVLIACVKGLIDELKNVSKLVTNIQQLESLSNIQKTMTDRLEVENNKLNVELLM